MELGHTTYRTCETSDILDHGTGPGDILDEIATLIAEGEYSEAQIRSTLEGFNALSDADKALVGRYDFEVASDNVLYQQVSAAGKTIIANQMPVLPEDDSSPVSPW